MNDRGCGKNTALVRHDLPVVFPVPPVFVHVYEWGSVPLNLLSPPIL